MEIIIILLLIIINGIFAMSEIAIISSRKSKLQQQAQDGDRNAQAALDLAHSPNRFLSTVQIGITFVGVFASVFGGATIAKSLSVIFKTVPFLAPYSDTISLILVVTLITCLSVIIGELVPKRLALNAPEKIAGLVARPLSVLSRIASPLVTFFTFSSDLLLHSFHVKAFKESSVSEEEVRMLIKEGAKSGVFDLAEKDIVERTLKLGDKKVNMLMTPQKEIIWLTPDSSFKTLRNKIAKYPHANFPVCRDSLDKVLGIVRSEDILTNFLVEEKIELQKFLHKPLFVPESMDVLKILELFKKSGIHMALVIDEYGNVQGLISLTDILEAIVGDIPTINELDENEIIKRDNGTLLVDGLLPIDEFKEYFHFKKLPEERSGVFHTAGGFFMHKLGRLPVSGDKFEFENYRFEVMDMDGNRVEKILIVPLINKTNEEKSKL
ncbi:MAG TPA: hemolysin family protein [Candidatus Sulfotelmatobacter sp.]|jgi:putative hemolysin|nr:hemolysin family protein [Candidatus Sulfotelmatobacter sp.]